MKTNEKELGTGIRLQENKNREAERIALEKQKPDTLANLPSGFRYKEDRSLDPAHPPVILDFSKDLPVKELRLSDIASKVRYIVLQVPDDSVYFSQGSELHFTRDNIIVNNNLGINSFTSDGRFLETICKNWFDAPRKRDYDKPFSGFFPRETFRGAWANHVYSAGNSLFYKYSDYPGEKVSLLRFSMDKNASALVPIRPSEGQPDTYAKGEIIAAGKITAHGETSGFATMNLFPLSDNYYTGMPSRDVMAFAKNNFLMITFNIKGDTLCKFSQFEHLTYPVSSTVIRSFDNSYWFFNEVATFKWAFNDTVFRLQLPNRLIPVFVFSCGEQKITVDDWLHVNTSLGGKMMINDILESSRYLFISYRYYPPENPKLANYGKAIYDKEKKELFRLPLSNELKDKISDSPPPAPNSLASLKLSGTPGLENDLDGGSPFWPSYITPEGKLAISIRTEVLISHTKNSENKNNMSSDFLKFVKSLKTGGREVVIMVVE